MNETFFLIGSVIGSIIIIFICSAVVQFAFKAKKSSLIIIYYTLAFILFIYSMTASVYVDQNINGNYYGPLGLVFVTSFLSDYIGSNLAIYLSYAIQGSTSFISAFILSMMLRNKYSSEFEKNSEDISEFFYDQYGDDVTIDREKKNIELLDEEYSLANRGINFNIPVWIWPNKFDPSPGAAQRWGRIIHWALTLISVISFVILILIFLNLIFAVDQDSGGVLASISASRTFVLGALSSILGRALRYAIGGE